MKLRFATVVSLLATVALLAFAQQPAGQVVGKQRLHEVPTPAVLESLRTEPAELPIEPPVTNVPSSDLWEFDPAVGEYFRRGELLVQFKNNATTTQRTLALQRSGAARAGRSLAKNWELVTVDPADVTRTIDLLSRNDSVIEVAKNYRVTKQQVRPNDEGFQLQWNFDAINVPYAWQINPGSRNDVVVAVIDTGLNIVSDTVVFSSPLTGQLALRFAAVPDLVSDNRIASPHDFLYGDNLPFDLDGHGTHVANTIAEQTNNNIGATGIAYNVKVMPLKVLLSPWDFIFAVAPASGSNIALVADAVKYAADNGAKIINMSLGGLGPAPTVRDAIQYAVGKGAFVAMAAGNEGDDGNPTTYPAAYASDIVGAMAVGAVNRSLHRTSYSTFKSYVEICAPGGETVSSVDYQNGITQITYSAADDLSFISPNQALALLRSGFRPRFDRFELRPFEGTSMATPHIAGVAALLYSQGIKNPATIERVIKQFAMSIDARPDECGAGLVDARRALRGLGLAR